jgi:hypothetical protein
MSKRSQLDVRRQQTANARAKRLSDLSVPKGTLSHRVYRHRFQSLCRKYIKENIVLKRKIKLLETNNKTLKKTRCKCILNDSNVSLCNKTNDLVKSLCIKLTNTL